MNTAEVEQSRVAGELAGFSLFTKEWREQRANIVWLSTLTVALYVGDAALTVMTTPGVDMRMNGGTANELLALVCCLSAALSGSGLISTEIGKGTLQFVTTLPLRRPTIWWTKAGVGLLVHLLSTLCALVIFVALNAFVVTPPGRSNLHDLAADYCLLLPLSIGVLAVALVATMLVDRTINALMITVFATIGLMTALSRVDGIFRFWGTWYGSWFWLVVLGFTGLMLDLSYSLLVEGESLRTGKRFKIALRTLLLDGSIIAAAVALSILWILE